MTLYLDTSSLVKLYVDEQGSDDVRALVARASVVATSVVALAESRAALARLRRQGDLSPSAHARAKRELRRDWPSLLAVDVTNDLAEVAAELAERYGLRGFDSLHLATYQRVIEWSGDDDHEFSSFDDRLSSAAQTLTARHVRRKKVRRR